MNDGWIKIFYRLLEWEWYGDTNTVRLFIHLLLKANFKPLKWRGKTIERGSFVTSLEKLHQQTGLSIQEIRTCLKRLISTNEITSISTNKERIITICKYDSYQGDIPTEMSIVNKQRNKQSTGKQQASNKPATTSIERKNIRKEEYNNIPPNGGTSHEGDAAVEPPKEEINYAGLMKFFNSELKKAGGIMPAAQAISGQRKTMIQARVKEHGKEALMTVIRKAVRSSFLNGGGSKGWKANLTWIVRPENFVKILEGQYDDNFTTTQTSSHNNGTTDIYSNGNAGYEARQRLFQQHIAEKLAAGDATEPDISDCY